MDKFGFNLQYTIKLNSSDIEWPYKVECDKDFTMELFDIASCAFIYLSFLM